ncbi:hypothetical protein WG66_009250 [Moniliophthora roreri]|nr:hypothetical protein WG66_009250 [Moniliophthora roreri]
MSLSSLVVTVNAVTEKWVPTRRDQFDPYQSTTTILKSMNIQASARNTPLSRSTTLGGLLRNTISLTDKQVINQVLLDAEKELNDYDVEISRLRTAILALESKREGVKRMMDKYRSLLSPIHRMPSEV